MHVVIAHRTSVRNEAEMMRQQPSPAPLSTNIPNTQSPLWPQQGENSLASPDIALLRPFPGSTNPPPQQDIAITVSGGPSHPAKGWTVTEDEEEEDERKKEEAEANDKKAVPPLMTGRAPPLVHEGSRRRSITKSARSARDSARSHLSQVMCRKCVPLYAIFDACVVER